METRTETTVCYKCNFFHNKEPYSPRKDIWYNHLCKASPLPIEMNPVTGEMRAVGTNDLGMRVYTDNGFSYCRTINKGNCELFEEKENK